MTAMPEVPTERLARLASHAVVVTTGAAAEVVQLARDELTAAGFAGVITFDGAVADADAAVAPPLGAVAA